ncbi:hypothetical protein Vadar_004093 [Vaccinium darrowii]|uniref:Uncharacterized protein n=1 Tax=Vaccinium darrowii TaxID=229202 RepID=A0ACB7Z2F1_9ERIC|nr:hypothetical protein Vadar_004093 [Vaccinium darrowii]
MSRDDAFCKESDVISTSLKVHDSDDTNVACSVLLGNIRLPDHFIFVGRTLSTDNPSTTEHPSKDSCRRGKWLLQSTKIRQARENNLAIVKPPVRKVLKRKRSTPSPTPSTNSFTSENSVQLLKAMSSSAIPPPEDWETYFSDDDEDLLDLEFLELGLEDEFRKMPQRTSEQSGQAYVNFLLDGHPQTIIDILRVDAFTFRALVSELVARGLQWDHKRLCVEESLAIFLYICGHSQRHRMATDRFQRSTSTISAHFKLMHRAICNLAPHIIRPPDLNVTPPEILHDHRYFPWFQDCVGAIDGTHIEAWVPRNRQVASRGRKPTITQNVMAVCSFDMKFTYVYPGWKGSAHDGHVFRAAVSNQANGFPGKDEFFNGFTDPFNWAGGNDNQGNVGNVIGVEPINMSAQNIELMGERRHQMALAMWESYDE